MNLDLFSLNLKSKSKYTTPRIPKITNLVVEKKAKLYSTPSSAKKSRFVPPLAIPLSDLDDFEEKSDRKSSHIKFLTEQKDYSTPRSIQTFVMYNNGDTHYADSALKIQKNWRAYIKRRRFHKFVNFIISIRKKRMRFALHLWILSLKKPADVSITSYNQVISFMQIYGYIIKQGKNQGLITKDKFYNVNNFNQAMRTDFLFIQPRYPSKVIQRYQRSFYSPLISNIFSHWFSLASEKLALRRTSRPMQELSRKRSLFGPMFWTFYFWKRWAQFKKSGKIPSKKNQLFLTEWSIYISKKKKQKKLNKIADKLHQRYVKTVIISHLRINTASRSVYNKAFENVQKNHENLLMTTSLRAFNVLIATKQFKSNIKRRVIRAWYTVIDLQITSRMKESVLKYRGFLKCLKNSFKKWQNFVIEEELRSVYLHNLVIKNNLLMLKTFFLLKSDFPHFAFVSAFLDWKKLIEMNHDKRRFITWSLTKAKQKSNLQSVLNIFKQNLGIQSDPLNFPLFENNSKKRSIPYSNSTRKVNKKRLIKMKKRMNDELPIVKVCSTTLHQTNKAYSNLNDYEMCDVDWYTKSSSEEVKDLFFRMVLILSQLKKSPSFKKSLKSPNEKIEIIKKFRSDNLLYNMNELRVYRVHQDRQDLKRQSLMKQTLKRDISLLMAFDTHNAAISLHKISKKFEINQIPIEDVTSLKIKTKKKKGKSSKNSETDNSESIENLNENKVLKIQKDLKFYRPSTPGRDHASKDSNSDHPFLRPIESVKKSIDMNDRKYRRKPEDIFDVKESSATIHNLKLINKLNSTASQARFQLDSGYEQFSPLRQSLKATRMMSSREFLLKELSDMHDTATSELKKINECVEYEMYSKEELESLKNDDDLFEKPVFVPRLEEIPTVLNTTISPKGEIKNNNSETSINSNHSNVSDSILIKNENIDNDDSKSGTDFKLNDISISDLSKNFVNDPGYFEYTDGERAAMLTNKYLRVLELLIDDSSAKPKPPSLTNDSEKVETIEDENDKMRIHISSLIRKVIPQRFSPEDDDEEEEEETETSAPKTKKKRATKSAKKRKSLFEDPDQQFGTIIAADGVEYKKSNCPEFSNVAFNGNKVLTNTPWDTDKDGDKSASNSSSSKKLRKKKRKKKRNDSDSDDDNDSEYEDGDDAELNMTSLPKPTFKVPGFDDESHDSSSINNSASLLDQINTFLSSSYSTVDDQNHLIEKLRHEAESNKNNTGEMRRALMLLIDAVAHKYVLRQLDTNQHQMQISSLVDVDGAMSSRSQMTSEDESSFSTIIIQKKLQKNKYQVLKKFAAFDTESRQVDPPEIIERKFTFTKDLLAAIAENAKFASTLKMKYYKDISKLKLPFNGMKSLERRIREKLASFNQNHIVKSSAAYNCNENDENEVILSIGDVSDKKKQVKKVKKIGTRPVTVMSKKYTVKKNSDIIKLEINSRPRTPLIDGCLKPEPGKVKVVKKPMVNKRKPQFTKMAPNFPTQSPEFFVAKDFNEDNQKLNNTKKGSRTITLSGPPAKLKWNPNSDRINITDEDVDFFMFVTPYVMPPEILNSILDQKEKKK
ncbi:hypothetical protein M9Y10_039173 [Tritrichomonas musculus]|uniref:Uncharacterized protein n=1 Tax=Tritrichomonas musculus TaxID=1915356 RepID=A0ABR2KAF6_9EUKA